MIAGLQAGKWEMARLFSGQSGLAAARPELRRRSAIGALGFLRLDAALIGYRLSAYSKDMRGALFWPTADSRKPMADSR
jgi:hypothetical protein